MPRFEKGYLFGEYYKCDEYLIYKCEPEKDDNYGIVRYQYGDADYCRFTKKEVDEWNELGKWKSIDGHWYPVEEFIDHHAKVCSEKDCAIADTVSEAIRLFILKRREQDRKEPEIYCRKEGHFVYLNDYAEDTEKWNKLLSDQQSVWIYTLDYPYDKNARLAMEEFELLKEEK